MYVTLHLEISKNIKKMALQSCFKSVRLMPMGFAVKSLLAKNTTIAKFCYAFLVELWKKGHLEHGNLHAGSHEPHVA